MIYFSWKNKLLPSSFHFINFRNVRDSRKNSKNWSGLKKGTFRIESNRAAKLFNEGRGRGIKIEPERFDERIIAVFEPKSYICTDYQWMLGSCKRAIKIVINSIPPPLLPQPAYPATSPIKQINGKGTRFKSKSLLILISRIEKIARVSLDKNRAPPSPSTLPSLSLPLSGIHQLFLLVRIALHFRGFEVNIEPRDLMAIIYIAGRELSN